MDVTQIRLIVSDFAGMFLHDRVALAEVVPDLLELQQWLVTR